MYSYLSTEQRVPLDHPLRAIREMGDEALKSLSSRFAGLYSGIGRRSIAPEKLLRALLLQVLFSIRSERMLIEQLDYNLLFRWFVGINMDEPVWNPTVFSKNRERLLKGDIAQAFFEAVLSQARERELLSDDHFTVDGTLLEAWASKKSFQRKEDPPSEGSGSRGEVLLRDTHECKTDPAFFSEIAICRLSGKLENVVFGRSVAGFSRLVGEFSRPQGKEGSTLLPCRFH